MLIMHKSFHLACLFFLGLALPIEANEDVQTGDTNIEEDVSSNLILFEDVEVKKICVSLWDQDADEELSYDEASCVTDLGMAFRQNKVITSFHELQFFTGLSVIPQYAFYQSSIKHVTFPPNITEIGHYAFCGSSLEGTVTIPGNVKTIGGYSFGKCSKITRVIVENGVEVIWGEAFTGNIHTMFLPGSITNLSAEFVVPYQSTGLSSRDFEFYLFVDSQEPVPTSEYAFRRLFGEGVLVVPYGAKENYTSNQLWFNFYRVMEMGDVNEDGAVDATDRDMLAAFINGEEVEPFNEDIADMNKDRVVDQLDLDLFIEIVPLIPAVPTFVDHVIKTNHDEGVYTMDGRRVLDDASQIHSLRPGIYIAHGRKVVVR